jgi:hypothetical protein
VDAVKLVGTRLLVAALMLLPQVAAACPNCVGNSDRNTTILKLVGAFMLVPFIICYVVIRIIRRAERDIVEK